LSVDGQPLKQAPWQPRHLAIEFKCHQAGLQVGSLQQGSSLQGIEPDRIKTERMEQHGLRSDRIFLASVVGRRD
jgi:hypothetical protein